MDVAVQSVACHVNTWKCFATPEDFKIEPTPEIHAKVLRSSATQATWAQALVIWHVISLAQFSLRCCQLVERCQSSIGGGTAVARGTNRAHNGSEDCQDCNDHIDSAGSNCTPHHCVRCHTLRSPLSESSDSVSLRTSGTRLGVSNAQLRIALQSAGISSAAQRVLSSTVRCVEHCDIIVVQVDKNVGPHVKFRVFVHAHKPRLRGDLQLIEFSHELDCGILYLQMWVLVDCAVNQTELGTLKRCAEHESETRIKTSARRNNTR